MKIYIETLGCPKNQNDSEAAAGILEKEGHQIVLSPDEADVLMVNTCGFINDAKKESIQRIFEMSEEKNQGASLVVTGCLSQRYGEELYKEMPEVDLFLGVNEYPRLPELLQGLGKDKREKHLSASGKEYVELPDRKRLSGSWSATIKISEGCDNRCAYCVIPGIRGGYRSRTREAILAEAKKLAEEGCRELIIIAQDVTTYGLDLYGRLALPELLKDLCRIEKLKWIRLMYCYEDRITDELIQVIKEEEKICHYLDIPLQHGSPRILKAMRRPAAAERVLERVRQWREVCPDITLRSTFIVGFPGETDEDFETLLDFIREARLDRVGCFTYSPVDGATANELPGAVPESVKEARMARFMEVQAGISEARLAEKVGRRMRVLVDDLDEDGTAIARSSADAPEIDGLVFVEDGEALRPGDWADVEIIDASEHDLFARQTEGTIGPTN